MKRLICLFAAIVLVTGACGGGSDGDSPGASDTTSAPTTSTVAVTTTLATTTTEAETTTTSTSTTTTTTMLAYGPPSLTLPSELEPVVELVAELEELETSEEFETFRFGISVALTQRGEHETIDQLIEAADVVSAYLETNPEDVDALILFGRLGRIRIVLQPQVETYGDVEVPELPAMVPKAELHDTLAAAIQLDPVRADAAYWQARLYGVSTGFELDPSDLGQAIDHATIAVALEPANAGYRIALAGYLRMAGETDQALATLDDLVPDHPLAVWLRSIATPLPLPEATMHDTELSQGLLERATELSGTANASAAVYVVVGGIEEIEEYYSSLMPGFGFANCEVIPDEGAATKTACEQRIRLVGDEWQAATEEELAGDAGNGEYHVVIWEYRDFPPEFSAELPVPADSTDLFSVMQVTNVMVP